MHARQAGLDRVDLGEPGLMDAVVDFGILHHVPQWRAAVAEIARVLRPGGQPMMCLS